MKKRNPRVRSALRWFGSLALLAALACIQVVQTAPEMEPEPRTPDPLVAAEKPKLEPTSAPGLFAAPSLDPTLYYYQPTELWYRYAYRRWFQAFSWDGAWFVPEKVPDVVVALGPKETPKTLKDQVRDLDKKLEEIDKADRLKELEKKMDELDKQDKASAKPSAPGSSSPASGASAPETKPETKSAPTQPTTKPKPK